MSNWSTPSKVLETIRASDAVEEVHGRNRCKVMRSANCQPPLDEDVAKKMGLEINVDWGELLILLCHAHTQLINAFCGNQSFFTIKIPSAPPEHQSEWEAFATENINQVLQDSDEFFELHNSRWASVVAHGPAVMMWPDNEKWLPDFVALSDIRIPTDTRRSFRNLDHFAKRVFWSPRELLDEVFTDAPNNKWDKKAVAKILKNYKETNFTDATNNYDPQTSPEKFLELAKQDGGTWGSDALPAIPLFHFYFRDKGGWFCRVVPETGTVQGSGTEDVFLWKSDEPIAAKWQEIIHCQHGDLCFDPPYKFHSERGLGNVLLEPTFYTNLARNKMLQHVFDQCNIWLKLSDNPEKARAQLQDFGNFKVLKQGVSIVPQAERNQINAPLLQMVFSQLKQLQGEASASYTQQSETGTQKEQTAFETRVKMEQVNAMLGGILLKSFRYERAAQREICRRFCIPNSADPDVKEFQDKWNEAQIPGDFMVVKRWVVEPVTPLGMGNPTIAQAAADQLMAIRPMMRPEAQDEVLHEKILVTTHDYRKAARWSPIGGKKTASEAKQKAQALFGTLMEGVPLELLPDNLIDQIDGLMPLFGGKIMQIAKRDNMATQEEAAGLANTGMVGAQPPSYLERAINALAQDKTQKMKVKQYGDILGKLSNLAKGVIQRGEQARKKQMEQGNGQNAELAGKLHNDAVIAQAKAKGTVIKAVTGAAQKQQAFQSDQQRKQIDFENEEHRKNVELYAEIERERLKAISDAHNKRKVYEEPD